jgi:hypothetical protein
MTQQNEALRLADALDFWPQSECSEAAAELRRLHAENKRLQHKLQSKRAIFQAGRDSYETACIPYNTDDEAWEKFTSAIAAVEGEKT